MNKESHLKIGTKERGIWVKIKDIVFDSTWISSWGIMFVILIQVIITLVVVYRLDALQESITNLDAKLFPSRPTDDAPAFVEDISIDNDPWKGTEDAAVTIVEFADYECPACAQAEVIISAILREFEGQVLFVYKDLPLEHIHPYAFKAAEAANCAGEQDKYWEMHDLLFANQASFHDDAISQFADALELDREQFDQCLTTGKYVDEIAQDMEEAEEYEVSQTPTFFVNGWRLVGPDFNLLRTTITDQLEATK